MISASRLWDAQDALVSALGDEEGLEGVTVDLGIPHIIEDDHVWVSGRSDGSITRDVTGPVPSNETFSITVIIFSQLADDYSVLRDRVKAYSDAVQSALSSDTFIAAVPAWEVRNYATYEGMEDNGSRQISVELTVECRCW